MFVDVQMPLSRILLHSRYGAGAFADCVHDTDVLAGFDDAVVPEGR